MAHRREMIFKKLFKGHVDDRVGFEPLFKYVGALEGEEPKSPRIGAEVSLSSIVTILANGNVVRILPHDKDYF